MGQAAPADQGILWHQRERSETQIWIAISMLVDIGLYQILQILSVTLFEIGPDKVGAPAQAFAGVAGQKVSSEKA